MADDDLEVTVSLTRGTSTDNRDKLRATVAAADVDELDAKMREMRDRMEQWADDLRDIQPRESLPDDQSTLGRADS